MRLSDFTVLFKANSILRTFSRNTLNSSTFQACGNPVLWSSTDFFQNHFFRTILSGILSDCQTV